MFGETVLDAANIAAQRGVLVSEELSCRAVADTATVADGVLFQAGFMFALEARSVDPDRHDDLAIGLAL